MRLALDRGDINAETGTSVRTADGKTDYLMLRWTGSPRTGALAYVKPASAVVDFKLPASESTGRRHTQVLSPGHLAYRVRLRLASTDSINEGAELLDRAVALAGGSTHQGTTAPTQPTPVVPAVERDEGAPRSAPERTKDDLARQFHTHLVNLARQTVKETGYRPSMFIQMLQERGGLTTAQHLIAASQVSSGFTTLWEMQRLDLTVEATVLEDPWSELFTTSELKTAQRRLQQYGYGRRQH